MQDQEPDQNIPIKPPAKHLFDTVGFYGSSLATPFAVIGALVGFILQTFRWIAYPGWIICAIIGGGVGFVLGTGYVLVNWKKMR